MHDILAYQRMCELLCICVLFTKGGAGGGDPVTRGINIKNISLYFELYILALAHCFECIMPYQPNDVVDYFEPRATRLKKYTEPVAHLPEVSERASER